MRWAILLLMNFTALGCVDWLAGVLTTPTNLAMMIQATGFHFLDRTDSNSSFTRLSEAMPLCRISEGSPEKNKAS